MPLHELIEFGDLCDATPVFAVPGKTVLSGDFTFLQHGLERTERVKPRLFSRLVADEPAHIGRRLTVGQDDKHFAAGCALHGSAARRDERLLEVVLGLALSTDHAHCEPIVLGFLGDLKALRSWF